MAVTKYKILLLKAIYKPKVKLRIEKVQKDKGKGAE